ncbi:hypothetical protein Z948_790 [Sulfitobacter donghicola DSW-25 = KCTC 12864 = JCM 14565]|uniref:Uncharacterized protein n=1 Tax=Sulfitobacter donghicola DSW-25 = KCTC 12864 = JCM 14565 TaxID=1300350 RepID=A0A073IKK6_9RHOB|nr:hypothetical protein DSW25_06185 [Sulfitobacter donghicola DSW-25 = KCTC 12864 = JCM 14565]KIN67085.1 hypothetical protein Z948_790 [Sulfitobacter donghicola DSW-25 = KCTC 12864 = JCM 14565]
MSATLDWHRDASGLGANVQTGQTNIKKKTRAVARVLMWCNRMLVNGSTADFEHYQKTPIDV